MQDFDTDPRRFVGCAVGGPALIYYISPTEEELFLKYNPDLQKRSLENRIGRQEDFDNFVGKLKEYSKSDKPSMPHRSFVRYISWLRIVWEVAAAAERNSKDGKIAEQAKLVEEIRARKEEIRKAGSSPVPGGSL
jgi:hypothetical protein